MAARPNFARLEVTRTHFFVAFFVSIAVAMVLLLLAAWVTGGSYSPAGHVGPLSAMVLVLPMVIAAKAGLDHANALLVAFATYFVSIFAIQVWCIMRRIAASRKGPNR